jgi:hypothetical protein
MDWIGLSSPDTLQLSIAGPGHHHTGKLGLLCGWQKGQPVPVGTHQQLGALIYCILLPW